MFLILWPLALWMLSSWREGKDEYTRWIALFLIAGGGGSYFYLIQSELVPRLPDTGIWEPSLSFFVKATVVLAMYGYYHLIPYFFLMSGIAMNMREQNVRRAAAGLAVIPILSLLLQMPSHPHELDIEALRLWAVPYLILGCMLYVMGWVREGRPDHRKNRLRLGVIFVPIVAWVMVKEFLYTDWVGLLPTGVVLDNPGWTITGNPVELWLLLLLLIYGIRYGILGIRVRIERHRMDSSMRTMAYGTTLLNHSIKNEVSKVNFLLERLETQAEAGKLDAIQESAKQIRSVTRQLQHMSDKMKEQSGDIVLKEEQVVVAELIKEAYLRAAPKRLVKQVLAGEESTAEES
jgi:two-component system, sporulation sensor kinase B